MVLSDRDIKKEIRAGNIIIQPLVNPIDIQPSSLDVHLGNQISKVGKVHPALERVVDISHPDISTIFEELYETEDISEDGYDSLPNTVQSK